MTRTFAETADYLNEVEHRNRVFDHTVDGFAVWVALRFTIFRKLCSPQLAAPQRPAPVVDRGRLLAYDLAHLPVMRRAPLAVFTNPHGLRRLPDGRVCDSYVDSVLQTNREAFISCASNDTNQINKYRSTGLSPGSTGTLHYYFTSRASRISMPAEVRNAADALIPVVHQLGITDISRENLVSYFSEFHWSTAWYNLLLRRIRPKAVIMVNQSASLCAAAKRIGIPAIEVQHGYISSDSEIHSWDDRHRQFKSRMPIPDGLMVYGEYWRNALSKRGFWDREIMVTGSSYVDAYRRVKGSDASDRRNILFVSQGEDRDKFVQFIQEFAVLINDAHRTYITIKLHPLYDDDDYFISRLSDNHNINIIGTRSEQTTLALLQTADCHVSVYSTSHYEALAMKVPTVVLPFKGHELVLDIVKSEHGMLANNPYELTRFLMNLHDNPIGDLVSQQYYKQNEYDEADRQILEFKYR